MKKKPMKNYGFGARVKQVRKRKGITQVELAKRLGVTQRGISYYENEAQNPSLDVIDRIAQALGVQRKTLMEKEEIKEEPAPIRSLQKRLNIIPKLPVEEQKYLEKTIDMIAQKHGIK